MGNKKKRVTLYALSTCPECKRVKKFLADNDIEHKLVEVDLLDSGEQWVASKEVKKYNPEVTYPTLVIEEVVLGFDEDTIRAALELK